MSAQNKKAIVQQIKFPHKRKKDNIEETIQNAIVEGFKTVKKRNKENKEEDNEKEKEIEIMKKQIEEMRKTIDNLIERITLIEKTKIEDKEEKGKKITTVVNHEKVREPKFLPPMNLTNDKEKNEEEMQEINNDPNPNFSWAEVVSKKEKKGKKEKLNQKIIDEAIELIPNNENKEIKEEIINDDDEIREIFEKSSKIIGLKPISKQMIQNTIELINNKNEETKKMSNNDKYNIAVKTLIQKFFIRDLKMSQEDRNNINIIKVFPSPKDESNIMYLECNTQEDVAKITQLACNLPQGDNSEDRPQIVMYVNKKTYKRYQSFETLAFRIRQSKPGFYSTNIRNGKYDFILRKKEKTDKRPWKLIPPVEIPDNFPKFEREITKDNINIKTVDNPNEIDMIDEYINMEIRQVSRYGNNLSEVKKDEQKHNQLSRENSLEPPKKKIDREVKTNKIENKKDQINIFRFDDDDDIENDKSQQSKQ